VGYDEKTEKKHFCSISRQKPRNQQHPEQETQTDMSGEFGKWEKVPQKLRIRQKLMDTNKAREHQQQSKFEPTITSTGTPLSMTKFSAFTIQQEQLAQQARAKQLALAKREKKLQQEMQRMTSKQPVRPKKQPRPKKTPHQAADSVTFALSPFSLCACGRVCGRVCGRAKTNRITKIDLPDLVNYCIEAEQRYPNHQDIQLQKSGYPLSVIRFPLSVSSALRLRRIGGVC
jgi:hypothetical protein